MKRNIILVVLAIFVDFIIKHAGKIGWLALSVFIFINTYMVVMALNSSKLRQSGVPHLLNISEFVARNANGRAFDFVYLGHGSIFESGDNHWKYLFWYQNARVEKSSYIKYAIIEEPYSHINGFTKIKDFGNIIIERKND